MCNQQKQRRRRRHQQQQQQRAGLKEFGTTGSFASIVLAFLSRNIASRKWMLPILGVLIIGTIIMTSFYRYRSIIK